MSDQNPPDLPSLSELFDQADRLYSQVAARGNEANWLVDVVDFDLEYGLVESIGIGTFEDWVAEQDGFSVLSVSTGWDDRNDVPAEFDPEVD